MFTRFVHENVRSHAANNIGIVIATGRCLYIAENAISHCLRKS